MESPIIRTASWLFTLLAISALLVWTLARVLSDRLEWSQYLYWLPTPAILTGTALLLLGGGLLAKLVQGLSLQDGLGPRPPATRTRWIAWVGWLGLLAWMFFGEWHGLRYFAPVQKPQGANSLRVMYWNPVDSRDFAKHVLSQKPDVLVVANAPMNADWVGIRQGMGQTYTARFDRLTVVSRYPIRQWGGTGLQIKGARPRVFTWRGGGYVVQDDGQAIFVELETDALLGRPTVLWGLDLPSDYNLSRWTVMREAAATLATTKGPAYRRLDHGMDEPMELEPPGFPTPDLMVGDFNTPRGSASLEELAGTMEHAYDQAGRGFAGTWPRQWPVFAIDQAFIGPYLRATSYHVVDFGQGKHRSEVFDVVRREHLEGTSVQGSIGTDRGGKAGGSTPDLRPAREGAPERH